MSEIIEESKKIAGIMDLDLYMSDEELLKMDQEHYYQKGIQEGIEKGIQEGIEQGIREGKLENRKEMIINMYNDNLSIETISKYVDLSVGEVKKILDESE